MSLLESCEDDCKEDKGEIPRPRTVCLSELKQESKDADETDLSIGEEFFPHSANTEVEDYNIKEIDSETNNSKDDRPLEGKNNCSSQSVSKTGDQENDGPKRPKTVTLNSTNERRKQLVGMGAVSNQEDTEATSDPVENVDQTSQQIKQSLSPRPKSEKCYICGKEFLLSSLKVHEKQCAKKSQKENERRVQESRSVKVTTGKSGAKLHKTENSAAVNAMSRTPQKLKLEACYLCGRQFFVHSLGIHETQCIKNWKANNTPDANHKTVSERFMTDQSNNDKEFQKKAFEQEKGKQHRGSPEEGSPKCEKMGGDGGGMRGKKVLKTTPCYICGMQLLPHSLKIHEKKCRGRQQRNGDDVKKRMRSDTQTSMKNDLVSDVETSRATIGVENTLGKEQGETENESLKTDKSEEIESTSKMVKKPRTIICYICGQEFLRSSYGVHEKQCASKCKVKSEQEESNFGKGNKSTSKGMARIRKFEPPANSQSSYPPNYESPISSKVKDAYSPADLSPTPEKPRTIICYICGQEFLRTSYSVHEKQCASKSKAKNERQEVKLADDKKTDLRGKPAEATKSENLADFPKNITSPRKPKTQKCFTCGKETLLSSLKIHEEQCQKKTEILKNINQQKAAQKSQQSQRNLRQGGAKPKTGMCYVCGEEFLSSSIKVHEAQCEKKWNANRKN